ncbi:MAG: 4Fe-4S binding protein [Bacteroidales bacterium]|nr:4Fe-4S binding protein [Bacteroidales bacterium]
MRKIVQIFCLIIIAGLLGWVVSVDVESKPTEVLTSTIEEPTAVKDTCIGDCSLCEIECIYERDSVEDSATVMEVTSLDEFEDVSGSDEFEDLSSSDEFEEVTFLEEIDTEPLVNKSNKRLLVVVLSLFLATALAGMFMEYPKFRNLRYLFLLTSLAVVGFGFGGSCPCMLKSFDNTLLFIAGNEVKWASLVLFIGLIPLTYVFGRVWCGWICHFGALQEFIHRKSKWNFWKTTKAQKVLFGVQIGVFSIWVLWLLIAQTSSICKYDPFVKIFNLNINGMVNYIVVGLLIVLSLFVNRPFCRAICPIGFVLGWVARIPYAQKLHIDSTCGGCGKCETVCDKGAISGEKLHKHKVDVNACILCGECISQCAKKAILADKTDIKETK